VAPNRVHIVDVKRCQGAAVRAQRTGGLLRPSGEQLLIRGPGPLEGHCRDKGPRIERLLDSVARPRQAVRALLDRLPAGSSVPLHAAICLVDADLPWVPGHIAGVALPGTRGVARRMRKPGPLHSDIRTEVAAHLSRHLPPA
jgi:hypothetical protein